MNRRALFKTGGSALSALAIGAFGTTRVAARSRTRETPDLTAVRASWDRVIRTTVGLRPHRPSGFVLKAEKLGDRTLIHNYGHGGAGMSLAWGTGALAADLALQATDRRAAVLGCGSAGLTAARQLQRRGFAVTIYATTLPPYTTSNMSMAAFTPMAGLVDGHRRTAAWDAQFRKATEISYRELQLLAGTPGFGVYWIDSYDATDDLPAPQPTDADNPLAGLLPDHLHPSRHHDLLQPGEHPFPTRYAMRSSSLSIDPTIYLDALVRDFLLFGGKIVVRTFDTPRDLLSVPEPVIVNCTGLGSKTLFDDETLMPVRGQLTALVPQADVKYRLHGQLAGGLPFGMNPRSDGIILASVQTQNKSSIEPDQEAVQRLVSAAVDFFSAMNASGAGGAEDAAGPEKFQTDLSARLP